MIKYIPAVIAIFLAASCSGHYLKNRARDLADIATLEFQTKSYGASVRVGPIQAGLSYKSPKGRSYGLRGGHLGRHNTAEFTAVFFGADYFTAKPMKNLQNDGIPEEKKNELSILPGSAAGETVEEMEDVTAQPDGGVNISIIHDRKKEFRARSPFGTTIPLVRKKSVFKKKEGFAPGYYFTQIDITAGAYYGIRFGVNPGEFIDFLLGWLKIDLYNDDEPFEDPRIRSLKKTPLWKSMDKKTQDKLIKEMLQYQ